MKLRDYQREILDQLISSVSHDLVQLDTGAGKTPIEAALAETNEHCLLVAHRNILVSQLSEKLAAFGLRHDTISTEATRRRCILAHRVIGHDSHIKRGHSTRLVASIDSVIARLRHGRLDIDMDAKWLVIIDEAHHVVPDNKWGLLRELLPNARFIGFTATPWRLDGQSLHVSNGGMFERLVQAEWLRENSVSKLIKAGFLSNFRMYGLAYKAHSEYGRLDVGMMPIDAYRAHADGLRAVLIMPSIENAEEEVQTFREAGYAAATVHSRMPQHNVNHVLDAFAAGEVQILAQVDMLGEGFDMPGIEAMIIANSTASFSRYRQWIGQALRPMDGKKEAVIIDLCGNWVEHGMPDEHVEWDIEKPPKTAKMRSHIPCQRCGRLYDARLKQCTECGAQNPLFHRHEIGGHYVRLYNVNTTLIENARHEAIMMRINEELQSRVVWPHGLHVPPGAIGNAVDKIRRWFVLQLEDIGIAYEDINAFIRHVSFNDPVFWSRHFTLADVGSAKPEKCRRVFRKWQKSL